MLLPFRLARMVLPELAIPADEAAAARTAIQRTQTVERLLASPTDIDRAAIVSVIERWERGPTTNLRFSYTGVAIAAGLGIMLLCVSLLGLGNPDNRTLAWVLGLLAAIQFLHVLQARDEWRRIKRPVLRFLSKRCPDCDYDLRGEEPALSPDDPAAARVGPRHSPECGAFWPLIPPGPTGS